MKSIRKSLNGNKDNIRSQISTPLPLPAVSKPPSAILPPQKVIRALAAYHPQAPQELPFKKGDFFYVLRDVENQGVWYEAHNPISGARGLVPRSMFEEFNKNAPARMSQVGPKSPSSPLRPESSATPLKAQVYYAIVLHDFLAERADELDAKRGDAITVVAQSNREWFVAKPIGKLGRPGLIPVSFVEIHDPTTGKAIPDVEALMDRGDLPKVEDWKKAMLNYKQNSITLGVIDAPNHKPVANSPYALPNPSTSTHEPSIVVQGPSPNKPTYSTPDISPRDQSPECLCEGILLSADVISFHYEMDEYWFRMDAIFQPFGRPGQDRLPPAKQLILFRVYNDFYDFQLSFLKCFPREAGQEPPHPRVLPFMPGPADHVNASLTATRREELNLYVHNLCDLSRSGANYLLEHRVVREFLALKPGDVENDVESRDDEMRTLFGNDYLALGHDNYNDHLDDAGDRDGLGSEVRENLSRMQAEDYEKSDGSDYEDEGYAPSPQRKDHPYNQAADRRPSDDSNLRLHAHAQNHQRNGSTSSVQRTPSPYSTNSRSNSPLHDRNSYSQQHARNSDSNQSRWTDNYQGNGSPPSTSSSMRSSQAMSSRSRSHSIAASNLNNPPISAANPQTAFVKIKIFDRLADDVVAIRVHPRVTHMELMDKVQTRLGGEVANLKYRDSVSNAFVGLNSDSDLRAWMEGTDKHALYAD
ncbi:hypothetical protein BD779DRAFT_1617269 [Infundibulicybe gibba]|nr:hypothetical protein BD779DRAFT_1617269 [Infundibulicybe gibba]